MTPELQTSEAPRLGAARLSPKADSADSRAAAALGEPGHLLENGALDAIGLDRPGRPRLLDAEDAPGASVAIAAAPPILALSSAQIDQLGALFKLLSDKTRLAILQILCEGEMNVTALCKRLKLPQPTVSHHLGLLRLSRLIGNRRSGKEVYYRLHDRVIGAAATGPQAVIDALPSVLAEHATGLQIVDSGFTLQITTPGSLI